MTLARYMAVACMVLIFSASGRGEDNYVIWESVGSVAAIYDMPLEKLEQRIQQAMSVLPDMEPLKTGLQFTNLPEAKHPGNVLEAPPNTIVKELRLLWVPDPKKMKSIPGQWSKGTTRRSTVSLMIGYNRDNPSHSFLIFARDWSVKGGSSIPRTDVRLPFKMWTSWPQLLKTDTAFLARVGDGVRMNIIEGGTLFDGRFRAAVGLKPQ